MARAKKPRWSKQGAIAYPIRYHDMGTNGNRLLDRIVSLLLMDAGPVTVARIAGAGMRELFVADGELVACGEVPLRCRTQLEVRLVTDPARLLVNPAGNHHVLVRGHWADRLREYHDLYIAREVRSILEG